MEAVLKNNMLYLIIVELLCYHDNQRRFAMETEHGNIQSEQNSDNQNSYNRRLCL